MHRRAFNSIWGSRAPRRRPWLGYRVIERTTLEIALLNAASQGSATDSGCRCGSDSKAFKRRTFVTWALKSVTLKVTAMANEYRIVQLRGPNVVQPYLRNIFTIPTSQEYCELCPRGRVGKRISRLKLVMVLKGYMRMCCNLYECSC